MATKNAKRIFTGQVALSMQKAMEEALSDDFIGRVDEEYIERKNSLY